MAGQCEVLVREKKLEKKDIPILTKEVARQAFPEGNPYISLRDGLGTFYLASPLEFISSEALSDIGLGFLSPDFANLAFVG